MTGNAVAADTTAAFTEVGLAADVVDGASAPTTLEVPGDTGTAATAGVDSLATTGAVAVKGGAAEDDAGTGAGPGLLTSDANAGA